MVAATVTTSVVALMSVSSTLALIVTLVLIALLVLRVVVSGVSPWRKVLNIGIVPLLVLFAFTLVSRLNVVPTATPAPSPVPTRAPVPTATATAEPPTSPLSTVALNPATIDFGRQDGSTRIIHFVNIGSVPIRAVRVTITGANAGDFTESTTCAGITININTGCSIGVSFAPTWPTGMPRHATLTITDTAPDSPQRVLLSAPG